MVLKAVKAIELNRQSATRQMRQISVNYIVGGGDAMCGKFDFSILC